jgi:MarR-like DNA-binding transcriptional regulator SgrR of sgrS sRNA
LLKATCQPRSQALFSDGKFVSANQIVQNFLSAENFPEWKWALIQAINYVQAKHQ